ncbi:VanZ family protein [Nocardioides sp. GCM10027113]|uniref:VanZ family protein n=1 Tax=unclassified Nocardioides TaxID=2615069 RepID=UPI0036206558
MTAAVRPSLARAALAGYVAFLLVILLLPTGEVPSSAVSWTALVAERLGAPDFLLAGARMEFVLNALMVAPVPLLGALVWRRTTWRDWTAYLFVASASVELFQGLALPGRSAAFVDVVANTLGAVMGGLAAALLIRTSGARG